MPREITGFSNPLVKQVRALREKKHRKSSGLFLAEGLRILQEARERNILPEMLWFSSTAPRNALTTELIADVEAAGGEAFATSDEIISKISGKENPGAVIGIYKEFLTPLDKIDRSASAIWLVAERLRDPGNLGTILRTGDAVGAGGLILIDDCTDPFSVEAVRASMGAVFTQTIATASWSAFVEWFRSGAGQLVATSLNESSDYQSISYAAPTFLLIGNESQGLPLDYERECDLRVKIPMMGRADSLNAAMACAVVAYEVLNQQRRIDS